MMKTAAERCGGIDVLINNAGISVSGLFTDITLEQEKRIWEVNVMGAMNCARYALPFMLNRKYGKIINISSMWGQTGASCEVHYSASKAALIGFTKALAKELGPSGINVNCIAPGFITTEMNSCHSPETFQQFKEETPLERLGTPEDIAQTAAFLASDKASFITGQVIGVNGGYVI
jgi:3-oxoacyl-[acyl-carrier protein] reductase